jgi:hypothetical protein
MTASGASINDGNSGNNYSIHYVTNLTGVITQRDLTITAIDDEKYCGQVNPTFFVSYNGFVLGENESVLGGSLVFITNANASSPAGDYDVTPEGLISTNYDITFKPGTLTIKPISSITYTGSVNPVPVSGNTATVSLAATIVPAVANVTVYFYLNDAGTEVGIGSTNNYGVASFSVSLTTGVYKVVAIAGSGCATSDAVYLPIYDPNGGFVTGGGWINSPAGAYVPDGSLTGKANFGFVSKYQKGSNTPTGNTEFQFKAGDLNFKSSSYNTGSLVIAGSKAIYKGVGTINGATGFSFMVSAIDGSPDKFRIKIWNTATSATVYDNQIGGTLDENADPVTAIAGGSIQIQGTKNGKRDSAPEETTIAQEIPSSAISVYPNPIEDKIHVIYQSESTSQVGMQLIDLNGRSLKAVNFEANPQGEYEMSVSEISMNSGFYLLRIAQDKRSKTIKLYKQ